MTAPQFFDIGPNISILVADRRKILSCLSSIDFFVFQIIS
jgi:hypothetical protein